MSSADRPSVFGKVNQADMVARLDAVNDDDLDSEFFADSLSDVEHAATRMFDVGIAALAQPGAPRAGFPQVAASAAPSLPPTSAAGDATVIARLAGDAAAQRAFILRGPLGLANEAGTTG
ncbi:MAG: hypothetical protein Q8M17_04275 [Actinomycetota bacterium]|nr:hypothetical protein [Actinomycetota bacterium]